MTHRSGIYEIRNTANGKRYVGSAVDFVRRERQHRLALRAGRHHSPPLQRAWNKYGEESFVVAQLIICSRDSLLYYEQRCIDGFKSYGPCGYNARPTANSNLGMKASAATKAKMSAAGTGRRHTDETRRRLSEMAKGRPSPNVGRKHSIESRARMSDVARATGRRPNDAAIEASRQRAKSGLHRGHKHTATARSKMSAKSRGRVIGAKERERRTAGLQKHYQDPEARANGAARLAALRANPEIQERRLAAMRVAALARRKD